MFRMSNWIKMEAKARSVELGITKMKRVSKTMREKSEKKLFQTNMVTWPTEVMVV